MAARLCRLASLLTALLILASPGRGEQAAKGDEEEPRKLSFLDSLLEGMTKRGEEQEGTPTETDNGGVQAPQDGGSSVSGFK